MIRYVIKPFNYDRVVHKSSFHLSEITNFFYDNLEKYMKKVMPSGGYINENTFIINGRFININEGYRTYRWLFPFIAGKTLFEIGGEIIVDDNKVENFHVGARRSTGFLFGGSSARLLKSSAKRCAKKTAKKIKSILLNYEKCKIQ
jgi:hypothetical protein